MTWPEFIEERAERLAKARLRTEFDEELADIERTLASSSYPGSIEDFWERLYKAYKAKPKPLIKEATAAAALNALLTAADQVLAAKAQRK